MGRVYLAVGVRVVASDVEVAVLMLLLIHVVGVECGIGVVYHDVLSGLHHRVGKQPLDLECLLDQDVLHIIRQIVYLVLLIVLVVYFLLLSSHLEFQLLYLCLVPKVIP